MVIVWASFGIVAVEEIKISISYGDVVCVTIQRPRAEDCDRSRSLAIIIEVGLKR